MYESVDMKNILLFKILFILNEYLEFFVKICLGLFVIEVSYEYGYCNDGSFFEVMKEFFYFKEFRIMELL